MTYCVGLCLREGLLLLGDTRTNAGVDNISVFSKLQHVEVPGERVLGLCTAGNLAITQAVWGHLQEGVALDGRLAKLQDVPTMFQAARLVGAAVRAIYEQDGQALSQQNIGFDCSLLVGGQIGAEPPRLFLVYSAGNFIEATADTPFLQIGEHKYGKPILDRVIKPNTSLQDAQKAVLLSMDSTLRSNLSVGMPLDLAVIAKDDCKVTQKRRIEAGDEAFRAMSEAWSRALRDGFTRIVI